MSGDQDLNLSLLDDLITRAKAAGADAADALIYDHTSLDVRWRLGAAEHVERSESGDVGLRVLVGQQIAMASSADRSTQGLIDLVDRAVAMAKVVPEDPNGGLADPDQLAIEHPDLDLFDPEEPASERLVAMARTCEEAAMAVSGVTNSEGASASWSQNHIALAGSNGFRGGYRSSGWGVSASVIAGEGTGMETDYDYSSAIYAGDLLSPEAVGRSAGERTVARLGGRKVETAKVPVVFDPRVSSTLVRSLASAINGSAIARGTSFLKDMMGEQVLPSGVHLIDDPGRLRGLRSKPFDGEGLPTTRREMVSDGVLQSWFLDLRTARQLGLKSTGHASRGTASPPSPSATNLYFPAGDISRDDLLKSVGTGFYVTQMMGHGLNLVTGDYSRGASGFWIENGEISYPVNEVTVAGNMKDMLLAMTLADDLKHKYGIDCATARVDGMTVAGI